MTTPMESISNSENLQNAAEKMRNLNIGALPVTAERLLIGIVTDRDIVTRSTAMGQDPRKTTVKDVMTEHVISCYEDEDVNKAAKMMEENQVRRLVILDHQDKPVGIVALADIAVRHMPDLEAELLEEISEPAEIQRG